MNDSAKLANKTLLAKAIGCVAFLFAAFGSFLKDIAPPELVGLRFAVGLSSFATLIILLSVSALSMKLEPIKHRMTWAIIAGSLFGIAALTALIYDWQMDTLTYTAPGSTSLHVAGLRPTPAAMKWMRDPENQGKDTQDLVLAFGGDTNANLIWDPESISEAKTRLVLLYILLVISIAATIFSLSEGLLGGQTLRVTETNTPNEEPESPNLASYNEHSSSNSIYPVSITVIIKVGANLRNFSKEHIPAESSSRQREAPCRDQKAVYDAHATLGDIYVSEDATGIGDRPDSDNEGHNGT